MNSSSKEPKFPTFGGRYEGISLIKKGNGIHTLLGKDLETSEKIVIKTMIEESTTAGNAMQIAREADILARIDSPYLRSQLSYGQENGLIYLVMPFLNGPTLKEKLAQGPLDWKETRDIGIALFAALKEAHANGITHRDIKPSNIILNEEASGDERLATLVDFGLARKIDTDVSVWTRHAGTLAYVSPEQAGLLDRPVDERSDLYSAGIVLYECLSGKPPFEHGDIGEILKQHLTGIPGDLSVLIPGIPRVLNDVVQRLLRKDPFDRYQSAAAVLHDLGEIKLGKSVVVGLYDKRSSLTDPAFVGRESDLVSLEGMLRQSWKGKIGLIFVEAPSGGGKTRLLRELSKRRVSAGERIFAGQGIDQAAQRPYQILTGIIEELLDLVSCEPQFISKLADKLKDQSFDLCSAFPELRSIFGQQDQMPLPTAPEDFGELRSLRALTALMEALGTNEQRTTVLLDDCQWADELTIKFLAHWDEYRKGKTTPINTSLVIAFRSEEISETDPLRKITTKGHLTLKPLSDEHIASLVQAMAGPLSRETLELIARLSEGSPFMSAEILWGLVESGALTSDNTGWRFNAHAANELQSSRKAATLVSRRFKYLPEEMLQVLKVSAILGKTFDSSLTAESLGRTPVEIIPILKEGQRRQILWSRSENLYSFLHDKLRETLLALVSEEDKKDLHRSAASKIELHYPESVFELAYHFDAAGDFDRALPYAIAAAEQASERHSLEIAERNYKIAERGIFESEDRNLLRVMRGLGKILMLRGKYKEAASCLQRAASAARSPSERAEIDILIGESASPFS
jgi:serine/threonine protein kinase/tetratricopeptide (TPR) repeat protein